MTSIAKLFEEAGSGNADSMLDLALAYKDGKGIDKDLTKFFEWTEKSANLGNIYAMHNLALIFRNGDGVASNEKLYFEWMEKAASNGLGKAMLSLAWDYEDGIGVNKDINKYIEWLKRAANSGDLTAKLVLALEYKEGEKINQNIEECFQLLKESAESGSEVGMYYLAEMYAGRGPEKDKKKEIFWLRKAASSNDAYSMRSLAISYLTGDGVTKNKAYYIKWITKAAENGLSIAMYELAQAYENGTGVKKNNIEYIKWLKKAAKNGHDEAMFDLSLEYQYGGNIRKNLKEAVNWLKKSSDNDFVPGMCKLAIDIKSGLIKESIDPLKLLKKASDDGAIIATIALMFIEELPGEQISEVFHDINDLLNKVGKIKLEHEVKPEEAKEGVAHFTNFEAIESMLPLGDASKQCTPANFLRLYNIEYVNDPDEGKRLINFIKDNEKYYEVYSSLFKSFGNNLLIQYQDLELSIYSCSFTLAVDRLDLWRAYGRDGEGICIVSPISDFTKESKSAIHHVIFNKGLGSNTENLDPEIIDACPDGFSRTLYKIKYRNEDLEKTVDTIFPLLEKFSAYKERLDEKGFEALKRSVLAVLSDILFLYKSNEYENEKEARLIAAVDIRSKFLEMDNRRPGKLFVKTHKFLFQSNDSKLIIGPKVKASKEIEINMKFRLGRYNFLNSTRVINSQVHYR